MIVNYVMLIILTIVINSHYREKVSSYTESAPWCLGCAQCKLLIISAILLAGRRKVARSSFGEYALLWELENYASR